MPLARASFLVAAIARGLVVLPHAAGALLGPPGAPWSPWAGVLLGGRCGRTAMAAPPLDLMSSENTTAVAAAVKGESADDARSGVGDAGSRAAETGRGQGGGEGRSAAGDARGLGDVVALEAWQAALPLELLWPRVAPLLQVRTLITPALILFLMFSSYLVHVPLGQPCRQTWSFWSCSCRASRPLLLACTLYTLAKFSHQAL